MMMMMRWSLFSVVVDRVLLIFVEERKEKKRGRLRIDDFSSKLLYSYFLL